MNEITGTEEWIATCKGTQDCFDSIWATGRHYVSGSFTVFSSLDTAILALADPTFQQLVEAHRRGCKNKKQPALNSAPKYMNWTATLTVFTCQY